MGVSAAVDSQQVGGGAAGGGGATGGARVVGLSCSSTQSTDTSHSLGHSILQPGGVPLWRWCLQQEQ